MPVEIERKYRVAGEGWQGSVELEDESEMPETPDWLAGDVTDDGRCYNAVPVQNPYRSWKDVR